MEVRVMVLEETKVDRINTTVEIQTRNLRKLARDVDSPNVKGIHVKIKNLFVPFVEKGGYIPFVCPSGDKNCNLSKASKTDTKDES